MQGSSERKNEVQKEVAEDCEKDREKRSSTNNQFRDMKKILCAIDGRFGKKVLKDQYRSWWRLMTYGTLAILFIRFVMFPILNWWQGVVDFLNYVIWG